MVGGGWLTVMVTVRKAALFRDVGFSIVYCHLAKQ